MFTMLKVFSFGKKIFSSRPQRIDCCVFIFAFFFIIAGSVIYILMEPLPNPGGWKGYRILLVEDSVTSEDAFKSLQSAGIRDIIGSDTALVEYSGFDKLNRVPVSALKRGLDPRDPRWDPYLRGIASYFHVTAENSSFNIFYISESNRRLNSKVSRAFEGTGAEWKFPGPGNLAEVILITAPLLWIGALIIRIRKNWLPYIFGAFVLFPLFLQGTAASFMGGCLLFFSWSLFMEAGFPFMDSYFSYNDFPSDKKPIFIRGLFFGITVAAVIILGFIMIFPVIFFIAAVFGIIGYTGFYYLLKKYKRHKRDHRVFFPAPLLKGTIKEIFQGKIGSIAPWLLIGLLCPLLILSFDVIEDGIPVPRPNIMEGRDGITWDSLFDLWNADRMADTLPDLSDYFAHRVFQEGFLYNESYGFPLPGEEISLTTFESKESSFFKSAVNIRTFHQDWFEETLSNIPPLSIPAMLSNLGAAAGVVFESAGGLYLSGFIPIYTAVIIIALFMPFITSNIHLTVCFLYGMKNGVSRRSRQEV